LRSATEPLVCPRCGSRHPLEQRFCPDCGMPLTYAGAPALDEPLNAAHERARKIKKQLSEGPLVRVAGARNQAEAELIQGLLLEEGVPSMLQRARGFDVPDMLAAGPRDVLVPRSGAATAREVLLQADIPLAAGRAVEHPERLLLGLLAAIALVALILWIGTDVIG
jgi:zinc ribbon protein